MHSAMTPGQLAHFERMLRARERQLRSELQETATRTQREQFSSVASEVPDPEDASVADVAIDLNQADFGRLAAELRDTEEAQARMAGGAYGLCLRCGEPIEASRLEAQPAARYHAQCQEIIERESGQAPATPTL